MLAHLRDLVPASLNTRDPALLLGSSVCLLYALYAVGTSGLALLPTVGLCLVLGAAALSGDERVELAWPLAFVALGYGAFTGILQEAPQRYVDHWLGQADADLFGLVGLAPLHWPLGGPVEEVANTFYASFYLAIPAGLAWAWRRGDAARYGRALTWAFALCALGWLALPAGGYHATGSPLSTPWGPATAFVRFVYDQHPHYAAAFPSSHVAIAVAVSGALLGRRPAAWLWPLGVAFATVYGQYHYLVDALAGLGVGHAALRLAEVPVTVPEAAPVADAQVARARVSPPRPPAPPRPPRPS